MSVHEEIVLELARLERRAVARVIERNRSEQLGLAWVGLETAPESPREPRG
jgi:hypothetical protein